MHSHAIRERCHKTIKHPMMGFSKCLCIYVNIWDALCANKTRDLMSETCVTQTRNSISCLGKPGSALSSQPHRFEDSEGNKKKEKSGKMHCSLSSCICTASATYGWVIKLGATRRSTTPKSTQTMQTHTSLESVWTCVCVCVIE